MAGAKAGGAGQGPANGAGNGNPRKPLDTSSKSQSERAKAGWLKRKMAAYAEANPESRATERAPNRLEIAELAQRAMPEAVARLEIIAHTSRSDMAAVQAIGALKDFAFGKDPQSISVSMNFEAMSDDELRAEIAREIGAADPKGDGGAGGIAETPPAGQFD